MVDSSYFSVELNVYLSYFCTYLSVNLTQFCNEFNLDLTYIHRTQRHSCMFLSF